MTDLTPDLLERAERYARERIDIATSIGQPDPPGQDALALVARVRELEAQVERVRRILYVAACGGAITPAELRGAIDEALEALGEES